MEFYGFYYYKSNMRLLQEKIRIHSSAKEKKKKNHNLIPRDNGQFIFAVYLSNFSYDYIYFLLEFFSLFKKIFSYSITTFY